MSKQRRLLIPLALLGVVLCALPASGQGELQALHVRQVDTTKFPSVAVTVSADGSVSMDSLGLTESGRPVTVVSRKALAETGTNFDVVLAIDVSNSVAGSPLRAAVAAAKTFVEKLPSGVRVGMLTFSGQVRTVRPVTADHGAVLASIATISQTSPGTLLYDGVGAAARMFTGRAQHNIVLLTDGSDVGSKTSLPAAIAAAKIDHAGVFTIGLGSHANASVLRSLAGNTGGGYQAAVESNLSTIYESLARELSNQFVLVYRSASPAGSEVTVGIQAGNVADHSIVLLPRSATLAATGAGGSGFALHGDVAFAVVLAALFLGLFFGLLLLLRSAEQTRRDRSLAVRMAASDARKDVDTEKRASGVATWIPAPVVTAADRLAEAGGIRSSMERRLERAGLPLSPGEFFSVTAAAVLVGAIIGGVLRSWWLALALGMVGGVVPYLLVRRAERKRLDLLHEQLPDVLMILASSLRAGHSFLQALDTAAKDLGEPSGSEFGRVLTEIRLGRPPHEALSALADRVGTEEFKWAILGINVQREVGGNLAEILDTLAETVRDRDSIRRQVRVLSAEARLSMKIMLALPPLLVLYMIAVNPKYMKLLWTTRAGWLMIAAGSVLLAVGVFFMRKLVKIRV